MLRASLEAWHDFKLVNDFCFLAQAGAEAVGAGVAAADDDDAFSFSENCQRGVNCIAFAAMILLGQELHGKVNALEFAAGNLEVAGCSEPPHNKIAS